MLKCELVSPMAIFGHVRRGYERALLFLVVSNGLFFYSHPSAHILSLPLSSSSSDAFPACLSRSSFPTSVLVLQPERDFISTRFDLEPRLGTTYSSTYRIMKSTFAALTLASALSLVTASAQLHARDQQGVLAQRRALKGFERRRLAQRKSQKVVILLHVCAGLSSCTVAVTASISIVGSN